MDVRLYWNDENNGEHLMWEGPLEKLLVSNAKLPEEDLERLRKVAPGNGVEMRDFLVETVEPHPDELISTPPRGYL